MVEVSLDLLEFLVTLIHYLERLVNLMNRKKYCYYFPFLEKGESAMNGKLLSSMPLEIDMITIYQYLF